ASSPPEWDQRPRLVLVRSGAAVPVAGAGASPTTRSGARRPGGRRAACPTTGIMGRGRMTDYFALLGEARRPWLDTEALKAKFLTLTANVHPDRVHKAIPAEKQTAHQLYTELNAAFNCLRGPKTRLLHLFELER